MNIAIDGPAGAGKSTIAKALAKKMGYIYVDTGAMYRAIALYIIENDIDVNDENKVTQACDRIDIQIKYDNETQQVYLNGRNVSTDIRKEEVGNMASAAASKKAVRDRLLDLQRDIAAKNNVVMDGRDIGTFVLPDAEFKYFLTASVKTRAERRYKELVEKGEEADIARIEADIEKRDYQDMNRDIAPLKQAEDAIFIDSSYMTIDDVVTFMSDKIK